MDLKTFESKKFVVIMSILAAVTTLTAFGLLTSIAAGTYTTLGLAYIGTQGYIDSKKESIDGS